MISVNAAVVVTHIGGASESAVDIPEAIVDFRFIRCGHRHITGSSGVMKYRCGGPPTIS